MSQLDPNRRFQIALDRARAEWAAAEPARCAALAGCPLTPEGIVVPYFGRPQRVTYPDGAATTAEGKPVHISINIVLLHYLLTADGAAPADRWLSFRELPDGLFYAQAFAGHAEGEISQRFGADVAGFRPAATALGGATLDLADASFRFQALPRLAVAVLLWTGDDEFPGQARILFDAHAGHYLPTEDLAGIGDWLAHKLISTRP
ncbi:MAG: DUF3786 domain-containing protein [Chloroflexi bacterium]|nr:DUF3786 domain-containing protein [Chloroflexota bacterium]